MKDVEILGFTLTEVADLLERGDVSAVQVTEAAIARARSVGPALNCFASLEAEGALIEADKADSERRRGTPGGSLRGVPLAHKDVFYRSGKVVASGSKIRKDFVPQNTATVLERLTAAGALNLGSLHMAEFAFSPTGYNEHYGHVLNPWSMPHVPGGSSSGSGAAVAARIVFGSLGTDTGGSLRHPAAMCGLTALKPTLTRVSRAGVMPLSHSLDCVGPLARTARDCARLLDIIAGADPADPTSSSQRVPHHEAALDGNVRKLRIGIPRSYYYEPVTAEIKRNLDESLDVFRNMGAELVEVSIPDMNLINSLAHVLMSVEAATIHRHWLETRREDYADQVRSRIEPGLFYPATRYCEALGMRASLCKEFLDTALNGMDALHLPAIPVPVPTIESTTRGNPADIAQVIGVIGHCTRGINYLGLPAVAVPAGFDSQGLPVSFQLVGRPFSEATLLRIADAYQRPTEWHRRTPDLSALAT